MAHLVVLLCFCIAKRTVGYKDAFANGKIFVEMPAKSALVLLSHEEDYLTTDPLSPED